VNFRELCKDTIGELGVGGGSRSFSGVASARGEHGIIVGLINKAHTDICNRYIDWKFLWKDYKERLLSGARVASPPSTVAGYTPIVKHWKRESFFLDLETASAKALQFIEFSQWRALSRFSALVTEAPSTFSINPAGAVELNSINDSLRWLHAEYYQRPQAMVLDTDLPLVPVDFHRLIVVRAKIYYGEREDAPEIVSGSSGEHDDLMMALESSELENWAPNGMGTPDLEHITPSFDR